MTAIRDCSNEVRGLSFTCDPTNRKRGRRSANGAVELSVLMNLDMRKLADEISKIFQDIIPHDTATIAMPDPAMDGLVVHFPRSGDGGAPRRQVRVPLEGSSDGEAFRTRHALVLNWIEDSHLKREWVGHLIDVAMQSGCWVPVIYRGDPAGVLAVAAAWHLRSASAMLK